MNWKNLEGSGRSITEILSWNLTGESREKSEKAPSGEPVSPMIFETNTFRKSPEH
jgi:hypothetical protein